MNLRGGILAVPKRGFTKDEWEDAIAPLEWPAAISLPFTCAIADGATESSFSGLWARLLTAQFVECGGELEILDEKFPDICNRWKEEVTSKPLPWFAEQKLEQGAFATLLGITFDPGDEPDLVTWRAFAVGDSCLFHVTTRGEAPSFPVSASADLARWPFLISSKSDAHTSLSEIGQVRRGTLCVGERLFLVTDALAGWALKAIERGENPWAAEAGIPRSTDDFVRWIEGLREKSGMKNDDCTLIWIEATDGEPESNGASPVTGI